jgi:hypothetical protein
LRLRYYDWDMIAMAVHDDWVSVAKAAEIADCSEQFIRRLLLKHLPRDAKGKPSSDRTRGCPLDGWLVNGRAWTVSRASAEALKGTLTSRAGKRKRATTRPTTKRKSR